MLRGCKRLGSSKRLPDRQAIGRGRSERWTAPGKTRDDEAPVIHEQIADLRTTLAKLDRGVTESQADVLRREEAVAWLREPGHLPAALEHTYHDQRRALNVRLRPPIDKLESRFGNDRRGDEVAMGNSHGPGTRKCGKPLSRSCQKLRRRKRART